MTEHRHGGRRPVTRRTFVVLVAVAVLTFATGSAAIAFWSGSGNGSGSGGTDTTQAITLGPATPQTQVYPGGQASVVLIVTNPNRSSVRIGSLNLRTSEGTGGFGVDAGHSGCELAALSYTSQSNAGAGWTVPAKSGSTAGSLSITLSSALAMSTSAADACQGASFTVYLTAVA